KTQQVLDALGHVVATIDPAGNTSTAIFNPTGGNNVSGDANGAQVVQQFDAAGRPVALTDANGNTTMWQYDRAGNQIAELEPNGASVTWSYNSVNQPTGRTDQLGRRE